MKKIYLFFKPFDMKQKLIVYDKETQKAIEEMDYNLDALVPSLIFSFIERYNVKDIEILGPKAFTHRKKEELSQYDLTRYGKSTININLN